MTRAQGVVAAVALAAMAGCLYLIIEAGRRIYESIGPSKAVVTDDGSLYLVSHGAVHVFGADGVRRQTIDLHALGVTRTPSDLAVHRDGRIVVASPDGSDLARCAPGAKSCEHIDPKLKRIPMQKSLPLNSVKVFIDEERQRYYLSDNAGHRAVITDFSGAHIAETPRAALAYPNQLAFEGPGELRVVDTNHHRIAIFDVSGNGFGRVLREILVSSPGIAREDRTWPFDALRTPAGETWALLADGRMKDADLIVFDAKGKPIRRVDLGEDSDPFDIEIWRGRVIVADATNYRVTGVALDGKVGPAIEDAAFNRELEAAREAPQAWKAARWSAQAGMVVIPLLAVLLLRAMGVPLGLVAEAAPRVDAQGSTALGTQIRWIEVSPAFFEWVQRRQVKGLLLVVALVLAGFALMHFVFGVDLGDPKLRRVLWLVGIGMAFGVVMAPFASRIMKSQLKGFRLGASQAGFHYELPKAQAIYGRERTGHVPWREVWFDGKRILAGRKVIATQTPRGGAMFDEDELRREILAHIPRANLVTPSRLMLRILFPGGPLGMLYIVILLAVVAGFAAFALL